MTQDTTSLIVMTGATSGIGLEAARALGEQPNLLLIVGAREPEGADALRATVPAERLRIIALDTASLASVRAFTTAVQDERSDRLISALGLNAGMQSGEELSLTDDGVEVLTGGPGAASPSAPWNR